MTWIRNGAKTDEEQWESVRKALDHQQKLEQTIASMRRHPAAGGPCDATFSDAKLDELEHNIHGLKTFFSDILKPVFYNERQRYYERQPLDAQPEEVSAAQEVLDLPELLELILQYLTIPDILHFQQVNRSARANVDGSPRMLSVLSLRADLPDGHLRLPFAGPMFPTRTSFVCQAVNWPRKTPNSVEVSASFTDILWQGRPLPRIGSRYRSMFVAQPPIKEMSAMLPCCAYKPKSGIPFTIRSETGLTIGDLHDAAMSLREAHRMCPFASVQGHDEEGFVKVHVDFTATIPLRAGDPLMPADPVPRSLRYTTPEPERAQRSNMTAYVCYKQAGKFPPAVATELDVLTQMLQHMKRESEL